MTYWLRLTHQRLIKSWPRPRPNSRSLSQLCGCLKSPINVIRTSLNGRLLLHRNVIRRLTPITKTRQRQRQTKLILTGSMPSKRFKLVRAPFDGIVTARDTDIGAYVAAGSGTQLFRVARTSPLRIYVNVSQEFAQLIKIGVEGDLTVPEFPGRTFPAHVTNAAGAIDSVSRSLQTELQIPNETGELLSGAYVEVSLRLSGDRGVVTIPSNAWLFQRGGETVEIVHPDGKVEIRKVTIHLNLGDKLEISQGLSDSDQVIVNPSDGLANGIKVSVIGPNQPPDTAHSVTKW